MPLSFKVFPRTWLQGVDGPVILRVIPGSRTGEGREERGEGRRQEEWKRLKMWYCGGLMPPASEK